MVGRTVWRSRRGPGATVTTLGSLGRVGGRPRHPGVDGRVLERRRLIDRCAGARIVALAAPGGYGKSTLANHVAREAELATLRLSLTGPTDLAAIVAGTVRSLRRAGLSDLADAMTGFEADEALDRLIGSLVHRPDAVLVAVDDAQHASPEAAAWLASLATDLPTGCRLLVAGRRIPDTVLGRYGTRADTVRLGPDDLRFDATEIGEMFDRAADDPWVRHVLDVTGGWPAAVTVWAVSGDTERAARPDDAGASLLAGLVSDLLGPHLERLRPVVRLPLLDPAAVELVAGPGAYEALVDSGLPMAARGDGWAVLPDPVRETLTTEPTPTATAAAVARHYAARGELGTAVTWLAADGWLDALGELLASEHWTQLEGLGVSSLQTLVELLGEERLGRHPEVLLAAARVAETRDPERRRAWIVHGLRLAEPGTAAQRALRAERARDLLVDGDIDRAIAESRDLLDTTPPAERVTRARALLALGPALAISTGAMHVDAADDAFSEAVALLHLAGETRWESFALQRQAFLVSFHGGKGERAAEQMSAALALLPASSRERALALTYYCEIVDFLGRSAEAEALAREAADTGRRLGDSQVVGYAAWAAAWICAHRGDLDATYRWLDDAERHPGRWLAEYAGGEFLAITTDMLAALGPDTGWREYLDRFNERAYGPVMEDKTESITSRVEAMYGDPEVAEQILASRDGTAYAVERDRWARRLLRAVAALRRGDRELARRLVDDALTEVRRMNVPDLPQRHEGLLVRMLADVWPATDGEDAGTDSPVRLALLGGFAARRGSDDVTPAPGHPATLVKLLALRGTVTTDQAVDLLWPDADAATGRQRLRNLLNRVRQQTGEVVVRQGESLVLAPSVIVDIDQFERAATDALAADPVSRPGLARLAIGAYPGELLPGDAYEDWTAAPRERLRRRFLSLVDLAAAESLRTGELDEAVRLLDAAIAVEPFGEDRYVRAAEALIVQGRRAAARDVVQRAVTSQAELGLSPGPALADLASSLAF